MNAIIKMSILNVNIVIIIVRVGRKGRQRDDLETSNLPLAAYLIMFYSCLNRVFI